MSDARNDRTLKFLATLAGILLMFAAAVVAVVSRTTPAQVADIVEAKQKPVEQRVDDLCDQVKRMDQRQRAISEVVTRMETNQENMNTKLDRLLDRRH